MDLYEKALEKIEEDKLTAIKIKAVSKTRKIVKSTREIKQLPVRNREDLCPTCDKRLFIPQDKGMAKNEIVRWLNEYIIYNRNIIPLDFLRSQKLILESIVEMRKK